MRFLRTPEGPLLTWSQFGFCQDARCKSSSALNSMRPTTPIPAPDAGRIVCRVKSLNKPDSGAWPRSIPIALSLHRRLHDLYHVHTAHCAPKIFKLRHEEWAKSRAESVDTVFIIRASGATHHHANLSRWEPVPINDIFSRLFRALLIGFLQRCPSARHPPPHPLIPRAMSGSDLTAASTCVEVL